MTTRSRITLPRRTGAGRRLRAVPALASLLALLLLGAGLTGCTGTQRKAPPVPPPPTLTGPAFLYGSVGSLAVWRGFEPTVVSGYGLVAGLPGTGSPDVPQFMREWLFREMHKQGFGSAAVGATSPARVLNSGEAAVVIIEGLIPPGAVKGTRFDLLVTAYPQTQTQSLAGGVLGPWNLAEGGANPHLRFIAPIATGSGPLYVDPFAPHGDPDAPPAPRDIQRRGVVLSGGVVTASRPIELLLNQPSYNRARDISERINEVFGLPTDKQPLADPKTQQVIQINVPPRYARRPEVLLAQISHLFTQRSMNFQAEKTEQLAQVLLSQPQYGPEITFAWMTMGRNGWPVLRRYYSHAQVHLRMAALEAGAFNGDPLTLGETSGADGRGRLLDLAAAAEPAARRRAAELMAHLPENPRANDALDRLLDDPDRGVRIAAYESLAEIGHPLIQRQVFGEREEFKFVLDLVPSERPMIYVTHERLPRIAIFNPMLKLEMPLLARLWDNRLMLSGSGPDEPMTAFYQALRQPRARTFEVLPTAANLTFLLGHKRTFDRPTEGLDLTYSEVVSALYLLHQQGHLRCDFEIRPNPLAELLARHRDEGLYEARPETGGRDLRPQWERLEQPDDTAPAEDQPDPHRPGTAATPLPEPLMFP